MTPRPGSVLAIVVGLTIHALIPAMGLLAYRRTVRRMRAAGVPDAPVVRLFVLCATYGGVLLVGLTSLFWMWSGMASLGSAYLVLVAPMVTLVIAATTRRARGVSVYHRVVFWSAVLYPPLIAALVAGVSLMGSSHY